MENRRSPLNAFLLSCVFLFVCSEVLLSPFYPQFFEKVYGITDPDVTGFYIMTCRLVVVIFTPIWGLIANKYSSSARLLVIGQWGTGLSCFLMAVAPSFEMFVAASVLLLIFKSTYFLLYTLLMQENKNETAGAAASYHAVLQGAIVTATVLSGWVIQMDSPLMIFWIIGLMECALGLASYFLLKKSDAGVVEVTRTESLSMMPNLLKFGAIVLTLHLAVNMIRPFLTTYTENVYQIDTFTSSLLYLIPSLMAIAALPFIKKYSEKWGSNGYAAAAVLAIAGLLLQMFETNVFCLIVFRCLFGLGTAWCLARLDAVLFQFSRNADKDYSKVSAIQNIGLLLAPVMASSIVKNSSLSAVFLYAGLIAALHLIIFLSGTFLKEKVTLHKEEKHALYK
ncbi:MFS transporter [Fictibacillus aquaticus]|uniref:MFS transporter n=1 Tax=Fictibacillus aquaticus TaxID=2021314 RepID=A0A235F6I2_9BACL|nr:MFS transporter [Fictibacillus aquaticus]OYD56764.1 hypothetical protein CGZ90_17300 [Fictibacillus aquaticus]